MLLRQFKSILNVVEVERPHSCARLARLANVEHVPHIIARFRWDSASCRLRLLDYWFLARKKIVEVHTGHANHSDELVHRRTNWSSSGIGSFIAGIENVLD